MPTKPLVLNETVSTTNMLLTSIAENLAAIVAADSSNARLASLAKEIADEAKTVAMGATRAEVFDTTELMQNWLKDPENAGKLKIGDNLYIKDTNVPDYWVSNVLTNPNDEGYYYEYAQLEIGKVNLSNVVKTDADDADTVDSVFGMLEGTPKNISSANLASVVAGQEPILSINRRSRKQFTNLSALKSAVADQNLEKYGLQVGDYYTANGRTYVIAGLNPMKGSSTPYLLTQNHVGLIVIPHTTQVWNASGNTSTGAGGRGAGYKNCDLHYYLTNTLLPLVQSDLGSGNLYAHSKLLTNAVNTTGYNRIGANSGCSSGWEWVANQYICALSEVQVYGSIAWSSSGYDTGEACRQLDVFRIYNHTEIFGGEYPWLRDVVSGSTAANADAIGDATYVTASAARYVAALILFH